MTDEELGEFLALLDWRLDVGPAGHEEATQMLINYVNAMLAKREGE
jgi:hypothetical protein